MKIQSSTRLSQKPTNWAEVDQKTRNQGKNCKSWWTLGPAYIDQWMKDHPKKSDAS